MRNPQKIREVKRDRRKKRIRSKISGTLERPRLSVFRSQKHILAQVIDDTQRKTLISASDREIKSRKKNIKGEKKEEGKTRKILMAQEVGILLAQKALKKNIKKIVFDRRGYKYHGRVRALAEGARQGGLEF